MDNFSIFLNKSLGCDPSLELPHLEGSNEESQIILSLLKTKNYLRIILKTPSFLELYEVAMRDDSD